MRSRIHSTIAAVTLALSAAACHPDTHPIAVTTSPEPRTIAVTGDADVKVAPDLVEISIGVESIDSTVAAVKKKNEDDVARMQAAAKAAGVEAKDIQTEYINLEPRYRSWEDRDIKGYVARRTAKVTVRDVRIFERVLAAVLDSGANIVMGIQFKTSELRKYRDQAREMAMKAAREKAEALAKSLGQELDRPHLISEEESSWSSRFGYWGGGNAQMTQNAVQNAGPAATETGDSLAPGQIAVNARVRVTFELK